MSLNIGEVLCVARCIGDHGFVFEEGQIYICSEDKGSVLIVRDDFSRPTVFYRNEFKSFFEFIPK